jgi:hypothetical protein
MHGGVSGDHKKHTVGIQRCLNIQRGDATAITKHLEEPPVEELYLYYRSGFMVNPTARRGANKAHLLIVVGVLQSRTYYYYYECTEESLASMIRTSQELPPADNTSTQLVSTGAQYYNDTNLECRISVPVYEISMHRRPSTMTLPHYYNESPVVTGTTVG